MKPSEQCAAKMLYEFLKRQGSDCTYEPGDDPPDYVFRVEGSRWAVEVTELHDYVDAGIPESALWVENGLKTIFGEIERVTATSLNRRYTIVLKGPINPHDVAEIKRQAVSHIRENRPEQLVCGGNRECKIFPEKEPGAHLDLICFVDSSAALPGSPDVHANIQATVNYAVSRIVESKVPTLQSLSEFDKRVLCILSRYFFTDDGNVRAALSQHEEQLRELDTVFVVLGNGVIHVNA